MAFLKPAITLASAVWLMAANTALEAPRIGFVRLGNGEVWSLRGIAGSFYFGQRAASGIDRMAFNGGIGIRVSASSGQAELLGASGEILRTARVDGDLRRIGLSPLEDAGYVLTERELWRITPARAELLTPPELPEGRLVGIAGAGSYVDFAMALEGQLSIHRLWLGSGENVMREAFAASPDHLVFLPNGVLVWTEAGDIVLRRPDASLARIETGSPGIASLQESGRGWMHASGVDGRQFSVRLEGNPLDIRMRSLPETAR
jgi:hypothetical protein